MSDRNSAFWRDYGLAHITPSGKGNPEGWDVLPYLASLCNGSVIDIGCGIGRLCRAFSTDQYLGVDINAKAVDAARQRHPGYKFEMYRKQRADTALLYTVLLHVADDQLADFVSGIRAKRVVVAEIMGRHWRREGDPPVYNRELADYVEAFAGWTLIDSQERPYKHYPDTNITFAVFEKCSPSPAYSAPADATRQNTSAAYNEASPII